MVSFTFPVFADLSQACVVLDLWRSCELLSPSLHTEATCVRQPSECC